MKKNYFYLSNFYKFNFWPFVWVLLTVRRSYTILTTFLLQLRKFSWFLGLVGPHSQVDLGGKFGHIFGEEGLFDPT